MRFPLLLVLWVFEVILILSYLRVSYFQVAYGTMALIVLFHGLLAVGFVVSIHTCLK